MKKTKVFSTVLTLLLCAALTGVLFLLQDNASAYVLRIARLCAINLVLALSMNLINGFTGLF
ncbi:MAG: branched-chain amino acid ABC transporter permease, partial [Eubacteriales bacterium]|nr:branched-chain amino acid ABC transporter permease [Eubacteriales bacterium]